MDQKTAIGLLIVVLCAFWAWVAIITGIWAAIEKLLANDICGGIFVFALLIGVLILVKKR